MNLSSKAALARIAIGLSLQEKSDPRNDSSLDIKDNSGFEFQRSTLTAEFDSAYKAKIVEHVGEFVSEEDYYPHLIKAHIERGMRMLYAEYQMAGNRIKLFKRLLNVVDDK